MPRFIQPTALLAAAAVFAFSAAVPGRAAAPRKQTRPARPAAAPAPRNGGLGAELITQNQLRAYLTFIADDALEGRDTPSRGLDIAARFLAANLARLGLKPMGDDGTYFQKIVLRRTAVDPVQTSVTLGGKTFRYGEDYLISPRGGGSAAAAFTSASLVYAGSGWVVPGKNLNAYAGLGDVRGKVLVVTGGFLPPGMDFAQFRRLKAGVDYETPQSYARKNGAVGIIRLPEPNMIGNWAAYRDGFSQFAGGWRMARFDEGQSGSEAGPPGPPARGRQGAAVPEIQAGPALVEALFAGQARSAAAALTPGAAFTLSDSKTLSATVRLTDRETTTQNVVAVLEGSDPVLKNEYVAFGAHYDHVGMRENGDPKADNIFNGADDDGSGTTGVLAIAEAFARTRPRPKRSLLFVWHAGEEKGLWGSDYFTRFPTVPLKNIVTQLNMDMIGRSKPAGDTEPRNADLSGPTEIYAIGSKMMSRELGALSERVNKAAGLVTFNYKYDDPDDPNRFFFRSDHFNYARRGIPIIFYFDGVHVDYHRPGDEVSKIDFAKMERVTRTVYLTGRAVADLPRRPVVDRKLPAQLGGE